MRYPALHNSLARRLACLWLARTASLARKPWIFHRDGLLWTAKTALTINQLLERQFQHKTSAWEFSSSEKKYQRRKNLPGFQLFTAQLKTTSTNRIHVRLQPAAEFGAKEEFYASQSADRRAFRKATPDVLLARK